MTRPDLFEPWYEATYPHVCAALVATGAKCDEAREATDEAFARALAAWGRVRRMESPRGWVVTVAINRLKRMRRRERLERALVDLRHRDRTVRAMNSIDEWMTASVIWRAVSRLSPRQRLAVALRYVADLPEADVARYMKVSRGTVASTLADAKKRLMPDLESLIEGEA
jgi:RNA polymerase sigma-70 factor (ECF subfamily)